MYQKETSATFTGHRSEKLPKSLNQTKETLRKEVLTAVNNGYTTFYSGMSYGFDLLAGAVVLEMKEEFSLKLFAAVPFKGQENSYSTEDKKEYQRILSLCDEVLVSHEKFHRGVYHQRNRLMVDKSSLVIAYSDGSGGSQFTVNYALSKGITIINLYK